MTEYNLHQQLVTKEVTAEELTKRVLKEAKLLPEIFDGLKADKANIKYGCLKVLRLISEQQPVLLYPLENKRPVIEFIKKQLDNSRSGTKKAAEKFVK